MGCKLSTLIAWVTQAIFAYMNQILFIIIYLCHFPKIPNISNHSALIPSYVTLCIFIFSLVFPCRYSTIFLTVFFDIPSIFHFKRKIKKSSASRIPFSKKHPRFSPISAKAERKKDLFRSVSFSFLFWYAYVPYRTASASRSLIPSIACSSPSASQSASLMSASIFSSKIPPCFSKV